MKKIPTLYVRDWNGDRSRVTREVHHECSWVISGEGRATVKLDGTCCMIDAAGNLWKRRELKDGDERPVDFEMIGTDAETAKTIGWVPVGDGPEDAWAREALANGGGQPPGTYELLGPKIQGNKEKYLLHRLVLHGSIEPFPDDVPPRDFDGLSAWLLAHNYEGIVWHHHDGRMAKIKKRDFGGKR